MLPSGLRRGTGEPVKYRRSHGLGGRNASSIFITSPVAHLTECKERILLPLLRASAKHPLKGFLLLVERLVKFRARIEAHFPNGTSASKRCFSKVEVSPSPSATNCGCNPSATRMFEAPAASSKFFFPRSRCGCYRQNFDLLTSDIFDKWLRVRDTDPRWQ